MSERKVMGLGLIGCGSFGRFCAEAFADLDSVRIAACADAVGEITDAFARDFNVPVNGDPTELISRSDVDIVHVATPPSTHYKLVMAAVAAGKHVLCEKPLAMNTAQADEMLAAAAKAGVIAPVNFVLRYNAITEAVKAIIDSGALGKVLSARLTNCATDTPLPGGHWFWDRSVSGGIFIEHGVHFFDLYSYWLGEGEVIWAHSETRDGTSQEDRVTCAIRHDSGAVASHYHGFDQMALMDRTEHRLVCEMGDIRVSGWIPLELTVEAAVDEKALAVLEEICGGGGIETLETYQAGDGETTSRGRPRSVTRRIRLRYCPQPDKLTLYAESVRALLGDQIAFICDADHKRRITESNGRDAVALAEAAAKLAETSTR